MYLSVLRLVLGVLGETAAAPGCTALGNGVGSDGGDCICSLSAHSFNNNKKYNTTAPPSFSRCLPLRLRVLVVNLTDVVWTAVVSYFSHLEEGPPSPSSSSVSGTK
jgi:hypothetical protein